MVSVNPEQRLDRRETTMNRERREGPMCTTVLFTTYTSVKIRVRVPTCECLESSLSGFLPTLVGQTHNPPKRPPFLSLPLTQRGSQTKPDTPISRSRMKLQRPSPRNSFFLKRRSLKETVVSVYADTLVSMHEM